MKSSLNTRWIRIVAAALAVVILGAAWAWRTSYEAPADPSAPSIVTTVDRGLSEEQLQTFRDGIATVEQTVRDNEANDTRDIGLILSLGNSYYQMGELETAATWYKDILRTHPNDAPAYENLGQAQLEMGDYAAAEASWRKALELDAYEPIYIKLADLIDEHNPERTSDIQGILETGIANNGQTPGLLVRLGQWYASQGMLDEAISHYQVARQLAPDEMAIVEEIDRLKELRSRQSR